MICHQTLEQKPISFLMILLGMVAFALVIQVATALIQFLPSFMYLFAMCIMILTMFTLGFRFVFYRLATYHYRIIEDDIVFERVVGRSNHAFVAIKAADIVSLETKGNHRIAHRDYFTASRMSKQIRVLSFLWHGKIRQIVIEPNDEFKKLLKEFARGHVAK